MTVYWLALVPFLGALFLLCNLILSTKGHTDE